MKTKVLTIEEIEAHGETIDKTFHDTFPSVSKEFEEIVASHEALRSLAKDFLQLAVERKLPNGKTLARATQILSGEPVTPPGPQGDEK